MSVYGLTLVLKPSKSSKRSLNVDTLTTTRSGESAELCHRKVHIEQLIELQVRSFTGIHVDLQTVCRSIAGDPVVRRRSLTVSVSVKRRVVGTFYLKS